MNGQLYRRAMVTVATVVVRLAGNYSVRVAVNRSTQHVGTRNWYAASWDHRQYREKVVTLVSVSIW